MTQQTLSELEAEVAERLEEEAGHLEADLDVLGGEEPEVEERTPIRQTLAMGGAALLPCLGAAIMVGGVFQGPFGRFYAVAAAMFAFLLAILAERLRSALASNVVVIGGLALIGLVLVVPSGADTLFHLRSAVADAMATGAVLRPPVPLEPGWIAVIGWTMGAITFGAVWVAVSLRQPALALLTSLPVAGIAGISVPKDQQMASGIVVCVLFLAGLGLLATARTEDAVSERPPLSYQVRRAGRAIPLMAIALVAVYFGAKSSLLFPKPLVDPSQEAQKPKAVSTSVSDDRVLFTVKSTGFGPWPLGSLDVYDGKDWRLPPFALAELKTVPASGIVDPDGEIGVKAEFIIDHLDGAVLPGLPNPVGIAAEGPQLGYDHRSQTIRVAEAAIDEGLRYTVVATALPTVQDLQQLGVTEPEGMDGYLDVPEAPAAVQALLDSAPKSSSWDTFFFLRNHVLDNVVAAGSGQPTSVPPSRVQDMLAGSKEGSPYEIVAAQALLARWAGVPSRIGYGFAGGDTTGDIHKVKARHGATFVEVFFEGHGWLPVMGDPKKAKANLDNDNTQTKPGVLPSGNISVNVSLPTVVDADSTFTKKLRIAVLVIALGALALLTVWVLAPLLRKARARGRRRNAALAAGPSARLAFAYAEWRDQAADFGYRYGGDTPLAFVERFVPDDEHHELAWLVTRGLWGDLRHQVTDEMAVAAGELSRSLRRRLSQVQPVGVRLAAALSRISLRDPYDPLVASHPEAAVVKAPGRLAPVGRSWRRVRPVAIWAFPSAGVVALALFAAGSVPPGLPRVTVRTAQTDVAFGVPEPREAPVVVAPPVAPLAPPLIFPIDFPEEPAFPPYPTPPAEACPEAPLGSAPAETAPSNVTRKPTAGEHRWVQSGTLSGRTISGFETRAVRRVVDNPSAVFDPTSTDTKLAYTFQTVRLLTDGSQVVSSWKVNTAGASVAAPPVLVPGQPAIGKTTDPEAGLVLTQTDMIKPDGTTTTTFMAAGTGLLMLPLPVVTGPFTSQSVDARTGMTVSISGSVKGRERVDACGALVMGWQVTSTLTTDEARSYDYVVAPQMGGLVISEHVKAKGTDATYRIGQLTPNPLRKTLE